MGSGAAPDIPLTDEREPHQRRHPQQSGLLRLHSHQHHSESHPLPLRATSARTRGILARDGQDGE